MKTKLFVVLLSALFVFYSCGKKEKANVKMAGSYKVSDSWGSSKSEIGSGTLEYTMTITADGDDGIIVNNVNKTLDGVKATVSNDSFHVKKQSVKSKSGKTYRVDEKSGTIKGNELKIDFGYDDLEQDNAIGYIYCIISGNKESSSK